MRADEFERGASLGRYEIIEKIAVGGMAEIYLARVRGTAGFEKLVVLKRILPSVAHDANFVQMFLDEARLAATLRHPNIADVFDVGAEDHSYYFAMEFIHGQDARTIRLAAYELDRDHSSPFEIPIEIALAITSGTAYALAYAHAKTGPNGPLGIVHRDITPSNILVSYDGAVKLVDFGIARADSRTSSVKTRTGELKGKIPYMSPEQCKGGQLDRRSDLFSLGTVLYELTTGRRPFEARSEYDTLEMIVQGRLQPPSVLAPGYPAELEGIVMKLLAREPAERYQDADAVLVDLEKLTSEAGLLVNERAVAKYMREVFAEEIAEWETAAINSNTPAPADFARVATGSGELDPFSSARVAASPTTPLPFGPSGLSLELDEATPVPRTAPPLDSIRTRAPTHLPPDQPTVEVKLDATTGEPLHGLLVTPEVQVFVRASRPTSPPFVGEARARPPTRPPTGPTGQGVPGRASSPAPSAATRAATLAAPTRAASPAIARPAAAHPRPSPVPKPPPPRDFQEEVPTTKATPEDVRNVVASRAPDASITLRDDTLPARGPRTQPHKTRPDPLLERRDEVLEEIDAGAPPNEPPEARALRRVTELCARCAAWLDVGEVEQAAVAAALAFEEAPIDEPVQRHLIRERATLSTAFESFLGDRSRPIALSGPLEELVNLERDPSATFLLSRIDGRATVEELLEMSGIPRFEAARQLCRCALRKIIVVG